MRKFELHHEEVALLLQCIEYTKADVKLKTFAHGPSAAKYEGIVPQLRNLASKIRGQAT